MNNGKKILNRLEKLAHNNGGGTIYLRLPEQTKGYIVATNNLFVGKTIDSFNREKLEIILDSLKNFSDAVGIWRDEKSGILYIDIVKVFSDKAEAIKYGLSHRELAIWDIKAAKEIRIA